MRWTGTAATSPGSYIWVLSHHKAEKAKAITDKPLSAQREGTHRANAAEDPGRGTRCGCTWHSHHAPTCRAGAARGTAHDGRQGPPMTHRVQTGGDVSTRWVSVVDGVRAHAERWGGEAGAGGRRRDCRSGSSDEISARGSLGPKAYPAEGRLALEGTTTWLRVRKGPAAEISCTVVLPRGSSPSYARSCGGAEPGEVGPSQPYVRIANAHRENECAKRPLPTVRSVRKAECAALSEQRNAQTSHLHLAPWQLKSL